EAVIMQAEIIDRGRGPEIKGTRITVYDVLDYTKHDWPPHSISLFLGITVEQVLAAERYIEEHKKDVWANYGKMLDRAARGNPPEIRAKFRQSRRKLKEFMKQLQAQKAQGVSDER